MNELHREGTTIKLKILFAGIIAAVHLCIASNGFAQSVKTYQVTGPVIELTDRMIVVMKDNERWEIARDGTAKVKGALKVGSKVTIMYRMAATSIEVKEGSASSDKEHSVVNSKDAKKKQP